MAAKLSPITPTVLAWALSEDGRSRLQIAEALNVEEQTLDSWVHGEDQPTTGQVSALADKLRRPRAMVFMPRPPVTATLPASFRHPPGDERRVGPAARRSVRQARRIQTVIAEALAEEPVVSVPRFELSTPAQDAAASARRWLSVTAQDQAAWSDDYTALRTWREALDARGIFVFSLPIGEQRARAASELLGDEVRGFSAWDDHAPLIVMNSQRVSPAARSFTLGHELGHLVTRMDAACVESTADQPFGEPVERWCEAFAAALLMPEPLVRAEMRARGLTDARGDVEHVRAMMRVFRLSARASALRLIDLGLAQRSLYGLVLSVFRPVAPAANSDRKIASPPRAELRLRQYGTRALDTVLRDVDPFEALSILRMTVPDARKLAAQVPKCRDPLSGQSSHPSTSVSLTRAPWPT